MQHELKDGYTRIANSLLECIYKSDMSGFELRALLWVVRNSYGYNRKFARNLTVRELAKEMDLKPWAAHRAMRSLVEKGIVLNTEKEGSFLAKNRLPFVAPMRQVLSHPCDKQSVAPMRQSVAPMRQSVAPMRQTECNIKKDNLKDNLKDKGRGGERSTPPAPGPSDVEKEGRVLESKIMSVAGAYADAKNIKLEAREVYLKTRKVYFTAKDLLALCQGNVKRAIAAIIDHAAHYKRNEKPDWKFEWILEDFYKWDEARIQNEKEE